MVSLGTSSNFNSGQVTYYNTTTKASANEGVVINANGDSYFNGGNVGIGITTPNAKLHVSNGSTGEVWTTGTKVTDCHIVVGGNEWGGSGENESVKIGLGYFDKADANIPTYIGCRGYFRWRYNILLVLAPEIVNTIM